MTQLSPQQLDYFVGRTLGDFKVHRAIGIGAFAFVYLASDAQGQRVAIKILYTDSKEARMRFVREAKIMRALPASDNVVRLITSGQTEEGYPYIVMEYVEGITLGDGLTRKPQLEAAKACEFMIQLCDAFSGLHKHGLVHRDIKPANVMINRQNCIKLIDFGLVKDAQGLLKLFEEIDILQGHEFSEEVEQGLLVGTPEYLAPEQMSDVYLGETEGAATDTYSDVYSLGLIFYQLLSGVVPFPFREDPRKRGYQKKLMAYIKRRISKNGMKLAPLEQIDPDLEGVLFSALRHEPRERPKDAMMFRDRIQSYLDEDYEVDDEATAVVSMDAIVKDLDRWTAKQRNGYFGDIEETPSLVQGSAASPAQMVTPPATATASAPGWGTQGAPPLPQIPANSAETTHPPAMAAPGDDDATPATASSAEENPQQQLRKSLPKYLARKPAMPRHVKLPEEALTQGVDAPTQEDALPGGKRGPDSAPAQAIGRPMPTRATPAWIWLSIGVVLALIILCVMVIVFQN